jgi:hypothetical protein
MFYFYSKFRDSGSNWMGNDDLTCATDEELKQSVAKIKEGFDEFEKVKHLQYEFMESHEQIAENVFCTTFSDGTRITANYGQTEYTGSGLTVKPMSYIVTEFRR